MSAAQNAANFDRLARVYAGLERLSFGRALARRRTHYLGDPRLSGIRRALVLGDGDGRFTAALLRYYPTLHVTAVDASPAMLAELQRRAARGSRSAVLEVHCADLRSWAPPHAQYDLVTTHFFFDCLSPSDIAALIARVAPALAPGAHWLVSDFAIPARGIAAPLARLLVRALYLAFWALTRLQVKALPDYQTALMNGGFTPIASDQALGGALRSELWQVAQTAGGVTTRPSEQASKRASEQASKRASEQASKRASGDARAASRCLAGVKHMPSAIGSYGLGVAGAAHTGRPKARFPTTRMPTRR